MPLAHRVRRMGIGLLLTVAALFGVRGSAQEKVEEYLAPGYVVYPPVTVQAPLESMNAEMDGYRLRLAHKTAPSAPHPLVLTITISRHARVLEHRVVSFTVDVKGQAGVAATGLVPIVPAMVQGRLASVVPLVFDGFEFRVEVREQTPDGPLVYRYRDPDRAITISLEGLLRALPVVAPAVAFVLFGASTLIEAAIRRRTRRAVLSFGAAVLIVAAIALAGVTVYTSIGLVVAAFVAPCLPTRFRAWLTRMGPLPAALWRASWRERWLLSTPAQAITLAGIWLLGWHHSLVAAYGFAAADFGSRLALLLGAYVVVVSVLVGTVIWIVGMAWGQRHVRLVSIGIGLVFGLSGLMRIVDWGAFFFSASHVDEDFWRLAFHPGSLKFAQGTLAAAAFGLLGIALGVLAMVVRRLRRWQLAVAPLCAPGADGSRRATRAGLVVANAVLALAVLEGLHAAWLHAWRAPRRDITANVRDAFWGVPEIKVVQPLLRALLAAPPADPAHLDSALVEKLERAGVRLYSVDPAYPLVKRSLYLDPTARTTAKPRVPVGTNIIIITVESLSRSLLRQSVHGVPGLTPHLNDFRTRSYSFENLFSSDFPTIKGMIAMFGGFVFDHRGLTVWDETRNPLKSNYLFLSDILGPRYGYETWHIQSDLGTFGGTTRIMGLHHYDEVHGAESAPLLSLRRLPLTKPYGVHDEDMYRFVVSRLAARDRRRPLFLTIAPTDTHFPFTNLAPHPATGGNDLLDSVHATDRAFGLFWEYFKTSPYRDNTVVLLTADHAMATRALRTLDHSMRLSEFDYIAAMLYVPGNESWRGRTTDTICTQLDVAPTLLDMMDIDLVNPFLGLSIFGERPRYPLALSRETPVDPVDGSIREIVAHSDWTSSDHEAFMRLLRELAAADRVWPRRIEPALSRTAGRSAGAAGRPGEPASTRQPPR